MTIFPGFERIRIINLPSRPDRRREMEAELRRIGLAGDTRVEFVNGVIAQDVAPFRSRGEKGVFLAHLNILADAAAAGESVLVLEDDVDFTPAASAFCLPAGTDIAYGGYDASDPAHLESSNIIGAHCMGFSARAAQALVPFLKALLDHSSPPPVDGAYVWFRREHREYTTSFSSPPAAEQRPSLSDIAQHGALDRVPLMRGPMAAARRVKRKLFRGDLSFGLTEAIIVCVIGTAIGIAAAWYYART